MRTHRFRNAALASVLGSSLLACGAKLVRFEEARQLGESYFQALAAGNIQSAMQFYSSEFADSAFKATWEEFLKNKETIAGICSTHAIVSERFAPRTHTSTPGASELCFVMEYDVLYSHGRDRETLTMCPDRLDGTLRIIGHALDRGGGKRVSAGTVFQETAIKIGG